MTPDNLESIKRRRQAIKIAAGVPTIFTLASGSVLAATSLTCEEKPGNVVENDPPQDGSDLPLKPGDPTGDGYVYDGRVGGKDRFVTASCWTSLNVTSIKDGASTRIA